jgi:hypothetical protein
MALTAFLILSKTILNYTYFNVIVLIINKTNEIELLYIKINITN